MPAPTKVSLSVILSAATLTIMAGSIIAPVLNVMRDSLGVAPSHYEPGAGDTGQPATTGAHAGRATGKTEDREALKL